MTSKQRAYLKSLAMTMDPILQIGKSSVNGFKKPQPLVIGRKIVLYKEGKDDKKKIVLP